MKHTAALLFLVSTLALAADKPADKPKPPVVPDSLQKQFFKSQAEFLQAMEQAKSAQDAAKQKQANLNAIVKQIDTVCGATFTPQMDKEGFPVCVDKPAEKPAAAQPPTAAPVPEATKK